MRNILSVSPDRKAVPGNWGVSVWIMALIWAAFVLGACSDDNDDDTYVPPTNIVEALK